VIRRTALVVAGAVALIFAPTAAMADYNGQPYSSSVSDSTPAIGSPVTVTVTGVAPGTVVTLRVSDGQVLSATANASGVASFKVTFRAAGTFTAQAFVGGVLVSDQVLTVAAASVAVAGGALPTTGFDGLGLAAGAGALVLAGAGALVFVKRRQSPKVSG